MAIKIIKKKDIRQKKTSARVRREIAFLKSLQHRNLIRLYEVRDTTNDIFLVMELVEMDLENLLDKKKGSISEEEALYYFKQILTGLEYCHRKQVSHRDLKPANILIDTCGCVKITDFGLSNRMVDGEFLHTPCGSLPFTAPEVIEQQAYYEGTRADIWSCGLILFNMVAGFNPFD